MRVLSGFHSARAGSPEKSSNSPVDARHPSCHVDHAMDVVETKEMHVADISGEPSAVKSYDSADHVESGTPPVDVDLPVANDDLPDALTCP